MGFRLHFAKKNIVEYDYNTASFNFCNGELEDFLTDNGLEIYRDDEYATSFEVRKTDLRTFLEDNVDKVHDTETELFAIRDGYKFADVYNFLQTAYNSNQDPNNNFILFSWF